MYNNYPSDGTKKICTVTAVDLTRAVCKCISDLGENMTDVRWLVPTGGTDGMSSSHHPVENSRVLVDISSGFPFILGAILNEGTTAVRRPNVGRQSIDEPQIADYTTISVGDLIRGPGTPRDQRPGDILNTTDGGAIQGVLGSGTVINKASPLSQITCSRYGDLVRIVARNHEILTDVDETYKASVRGRVFSLQNTFRTPEESRTEVPSFTRMEGDVLAAETVGKIYATYKQDNFPEIAEDDGVVLKEYTYVLGEVTSTFIEDTEGSTYRNVIGVDRVLGGTGESEQTFGSQQLKQDIKTGETASWHMNENEFHWNSGGTSGVTITGTSQSGMVITARDGVRIEITNSGELLIDTQSNAVLNIGGTMAVTAGDTTFNLGATTFNCSGNFSVTAPNIALN